ncbi:MAG TPA: hypothetical protein VGW34_05180 [Allosphingosinicella sp.]|nr:hypothetical protein [Allosphingosinicella sp.]
MGLQQQRRRLRLLILSTIAFGCSVAALHGSLAALADVQAGAPHSLLQDL